MIEILEPGALTTIQDAGRIGWGRFGVPPSGPVDAFAFNVANALVGNPRGTAALEITLSGPVLRTTQACLIAVCGAEFELWAGTIRVPCWHAVFLRAMDTLHFGQRRWGSRAYLAFAGGIETPPFLGSCATYLPGGFGGLEGRALRRGDVLQLGPVERGILQRAGQAHDPQNRPPYSPSPVLHVVMGPQSASFTAEARHTLLNESYTITPQADRIGVRLQGPRLHHVGAAEIVSDGIVSGCIQVPPDGQPIVMLADHPTTGGYPKIATVVTADLPLLAQCLPGDRVRFQQA